MGKKFKEIWSSDTTKFAVVLAILMAFAFYRSYGRYEKKVMRMKAQKGLSLERSSGESKFSDR